MTSSEVHVILACDRAFRMQVAVTAQSICRHFGFARGGLVLHVFAHGWDEADRRGLERGLSAFPARVRWHEPEISLLKGARTHGHVSLATYFRILAFEQLSRELPRVIYLDCDLVVRADLWDLWGQPVPEGMVLAAARDSACPWVDAEAVLGAAHPALARIRIPSVLPGRARWGLSEQAPYFNAGVLWVDLRAWRQEDCTCRLLRFLREEWRQLSYWDQDALNALLTARWHALPLAWNVMPSLFEYDPSATPFPWAEVEAAKARPRLVHYAAKAKPWHARYAGPFRDLWYEDLAQTPFAGWRPPPGQPLAHLLRSGWRWWRDGLLYHGRRCLDRLRRPA